ncbi:hypothetical protein HBI81_066350 [Parastagonospora nodorum]|nr:hypothetical protein HBI09_203890 [Parastagonospora nodorum]KAH4089113.1 hypothetical protein HBH46_193600 [Parastagonospora nodorum]KAH4286847.1 hypothetical protein HBI01_234360 [Parastagonospora nodorum]KAH4291422.1 hypothetical protein HBI02_196720 [Parastagonospora nodorum]KAH4321326.1 hypothetical protein HBI00_214060 [Parastagonospora nodorum]
MPSSRHPSLRRKISTMSIFGRSRSRSPPADSSSSPRPMTPVSTNASVPRSDRRHTSGGLRSLFYKHRTREPEFDIVSPSSLALSKPVHPRISRLTKAFADSMSANQLSNFLTWMLYYELVELPEDPDVWYNLADAVQMHGWIGLGEFLSNSSTSMDTSYGFDLVVLDSICDRLQLQRSTVHGFLIQFADPDKMSFSQIATLVNTATVEEKTEIHILEAVQSKLLEYAKLALRIKPRQGTIYDSWHAVVMKRIDALLRLVIKPRIAHLFSGAPLITASTSGQVPQSVKDGIKLNYLYEVMQQKRPVPLRRYGILYPAREPESDPATPPSSPPDAHPAPTPEADAEQFINHSFQLMIDNRDLRAEVAILQEEVKTLQASNYKMVRKLAFAEYPPSSHSQALDESISPTPSSDPTHLQLPIPRARPRSLSHATAEKLAAQLAPKTPTHTRHRSEALVWKYPGVFDALDTPPTPPLRLSDPATGELLLPSPGRSRRSGMVFSQAQMELVGSMSAGMEQEDGRDGYRVGRLKPTLGRWDLDE